MPGYSQYTIRSLVAEIAALIDDSTNVQWTYAEKRFAVIEAMRYWGVLTNYWKNHGVLQTTAGQAWYDLATTLRDGDGEILRTRTTTINDLVTEMQYHCCEQGTGIGGSGQSGQFDTATMAQAVVRARNRLVADTGLPLTVTAPQAVGNDRFYMDESTAWIRHGYWIDSNNGYWALRKLDNWSAEGYDPRWTLNANRPFSYVVSDTRPLEIWLYPTPAASGMIEWVLAESAQLDPASTTATLQIPDEYAPAVKYAALADIYSMDGETNDPARSAYADMRYQQYLPVAEMHRSVIYAEISNVPAQVVPISSLDSKDANWRMKSGRPWMMGADIDLVGLYNVPDAGVIGQGYEVEMDVVIPAPIPPTDDAPDYLQIGRELIGLITDYVQHYLSFKLGGDEFVSTYDTYDGFMRAAGNRNKQMLKSIKFMKAIFDQEGKEQNAQM